MLKPINIQLFAEPTKEELDAILNDVTDKKPSTEVKTTVQSTEQSTEVKTTEQSNLVKTTEQSTEVKTTEKTTEEDEETEEEKSEGGIKNLRKSFKENKKKLKEEQDRLKKISDEAAIKAERLVKAIKLGIKGDTEEEILENLSAHEIKDEAEKKGLTEDQIRKEKELEEKTRKLTEQERETQFNRRVVDLRQTKNLTEKQVLDFVRKAGTVGIDLFQNNIDFSTVYDTIMGTPQSTNPETAALQKEIEQLKAELASLKNEGEPGKGPKGNGDTGNKSWEQQLAEMEGNKQ